MTQLSKRVPSTPKQAVHCACAIDAALDPELFKALGDSTRIKLLSCLAKCSRPCSVGEVAECCSVDYSVISRHLSLLERAGVLEGEKDGRTVLYRVRYDELVSKLRDLADAIEEWSPSKTGKSGTGRCCE